MVKEDPGVNRFFYQTIMLKPMSYEDANELIETKLQKVAEAAEKDKIEIEIDPGVIAKVVRLSGGHPHILQLLGSHLVRHESEDPDGIIDSRDLVSSLRQICYEDRVGVYDSIVHTLELHGRLEELETILSLAERGFPTKIPKGRIYEELGKEAIEWFVEHEVIAPSDSSYYGLVDEFLRIRFILSEADSVDSRSSRERQILRDVSGQLYL